DREAPGFVVDREPQEPERHEGRRHHDQEQAPATQLAERTHERAAYLSQPSERCPALSRATRAAEMAPGRPQEARERRGEAHLPPCDRGLRRPPASPGEDCRGDVRPPGWAACRLDSCVSAPW